LRGLFYKRRRLIGGLGGEVLEWRMIPFRVRGVWEPEVSFPFAAVLWWHLCRLLMLVRQQLLVLLVFFADIVVVVVVCHIAYVSGCWMIWRRTYMVNCPFSHLFGYGSW
jgi:hypothetical protein